MIIKSTVRGNGGKLANYLLNDKKNDRAELLDMRGWTAENLKNALLMSEEIALGKTQCKNPFYHASFRLPSGEELTPEQWQQCADTLEKR
jgi:aspartate/tyrosine/aromatic aminotransferase